jgi:mRNA-degrading endonuclease RelE of RelBE toxin-antitoxin system
MSYKIELSANFIKEARKLVKKYPSLKAELANLFTELEENPTLGTHLETIFTKYVWPSPLKTKGNQVGQG